VGASASVSDPTTPRSAPIRGLLSGVWIGRRSTCCCAARGASPNRAGSANVNRPRHRLRFHSRPLHRLHLHRARSTNSGGCTMHMRHSRADRPVRRRMACRCQDSTRILRPIRHTLDISRTIGDHCHHISGKSSLSLPWTSPLGKLQKARVDHGQCSAALLFPSEHPHRAPAMLLASQCSL
jgi:hypothetical protein